MTGSEEPEHPTAEEVLLEYVERYGLTEKSRSYFLRKEGSISKLSLTIRLVETGMIIDARGSSAGFELSAFEDAPHGRRYSARARSGLPQTLRRIY